MARLKKLRVLRLGQADSKPQLRGVPEAIGELTKLTTLELNGQKMATLPEAIGALPELVTLDLHSAKIDVLSPSSRSG